MNCICGAFFFDPGEDGTPLCPVHQPKLYGAGEPARHTYCPDENDRCQHGDDMNCPALNQAQELAQKIVEDYERGKAKDEARGYHRIDGASLTDEVILAQEVLRLVAESTNRHGDI